MTNDDTINPVIVGFRVDDVNPGHVHVSIFSGRNVGSRGHSGHLVFRADEWPEVRASFFTAGFWEITP